jgi:hypothetical protein
MSVGQTQGICEVNHLLILFNDDAGQSGRWGVYAILAQIFCCSIV